MNAQAEAALNRANVVRLERARIRREVASLDYREGLALACDIIAVPPAECERMTVSQLLKSVRRMGPQRVRVTLTRAGVSERATLGSLTPRQRQALAQLRRRGA